MPYLTTSSAMRPRAAIPSGGRRRRPWTGPGSRSLAHRRQREGDRLHQRRDESINLALKGAAEFYKEKGNHLITVRTEHKATLDTAKRLERQGCEVTYLDTDKYGRISPQQLRDAITDKTILVSVMLANNEIGTSSPSELGEVTREKGSSFTSTRCRAWGRCRSTSRR